MAAPKATPASPLPSQVSVDMELTMDEADLRLCRVRMEASEMVMKLFSKGEVGVRRPCILPPLCSWPAMGSSSLLPRPSLNFLTFTRSPGLLVRNQD